MVGATHEPPLTKIHPVSDPAPLPVYIHLLFCHEHQSMILSGAYRYVGNPLYIALNVNLLTAKKFRYISMGYCDPIAALYVPGEHKFKMGAHSGRHVAVMADEHL